MKTWLLFLSRWVTCNVKFKFIYYLRCWAPSFKMGYLLSCLLMLVRSHDVKTALDSMGALLLSSSLRAMYVCLLRSNFLFDQASAVNHRLSVWPCVSHVCLMFLAAMSSKLQMVFTHLLHTTKPKQMKDAEQADTSVTANPRHTNQCLASSSNRYSCNKCSIICLR